MTSLDIPHSSCGAKPKTPQYLGQCCVLRTGHVGNHKSLDQRTFTLIEDSEDTTLQDAEAEALFEAEHGDWGNRD